VALVKKKRAFGEKILRTKIQKTSGPEEYMNHRPPIKITFVYQLDQKLCLKSGVAA